ncbi:hypothetical protein MMC31_000559 [Peltigera leucophlebia]|nr:hypothetical protein [Peltigera leucophlebia]
MSQSELKARISKLLNGVLDNYEPSYGLGSMTCSVYDTAWVGCVAKTIAGRAQWLFPCSFSYILKSQLPEGGWPAHPYENGTTEADCILSTMAALFCLTQHAKEPLQLRHLHECLSAKIERGCASLSKMLKIWRVGDCRAVGFEVLAPAILDLLEEEGRTFEFPAKDLLHNIRNQKLAKVPPEAIYGKACPTLLHSIEAFHGRKDISFDRISHLKVAGSMMASPSATASYLIRSTKWDDEAEAYLRLAISNGEGKGSGAVPSAYPTTNFEVTWVVSTLIEAGVWALTTEQREKILDLLEESRKVGGGLIGFAPGVEPDLDDSAKSSTIFSFFGIPGFTSYIVEQFDSVECLKTYIGERNSSVSANCNALLSMVIDSEEYHGKISTIEKITDFICDAWWSNGGSLNDKWNLSPYYPAMLMARSLAELLRAWDVGTLPQSLKPMSQAKIIPVLSQCLLRILVSQRNDGSWGDTGPREETAYAILTLSSLIELPLAQVLRPQMLSVIDCGRDFLKKSKSSGPEYLWIEKVTYGSANLAEAYITAALYAPIEVAQVRSTNGLSISHTFDCKFGTT